LFDESLNTSINRNTQGVISANNNMASNFDTISDSLNTQDTDNEFDDILDKKKRKREK
jgi:hypothetical protein